VRDRKLFTVVTLSSLHNSLDSPYIVDFTDPKFNLLKQKISKVSEMESIN